MGVGDSVRGPDLDQGVRKGFSEEVTFNLSPKDESDHIKLPCLTLSGSAQAPHPQRLFRTLEKEQKMMTICF